MHAFVSCAMILQIHIYVGMQVCMYLVLNCYVTVRIQWSRITPYHHFTHREIQLKINGTILAPILILTSDYQY